MSGAHYNPCVCLQSCDLWCPASSFLLCELSQAEIQDLHISIRPHHNVLRLNISMNYASLMCCRECARYLDRYIKSLAQFKSLSQALAKSYPFYVLGDNEMEIIYFFDVQDGKNIRMVKRRSCASLPLESAHASSVS